MGLQITVRTKCCESYKIYGVRCSVCPNRPENRELVKEISELPQASPSARRSSTFRSCFRQSEEPAELVTALGD